MTGFGASEGSTEDLSWRWELRSVNGKGLDLKFRLPTGAEALESPLRDKGRVLHRGTVSANLRIERETSEEAVRIDDDALAAAIRAVETVRIRTECELPRPEAILNMRGVLSAPPMETSLSDEQLAVLTGGFEAALERLVAARRSEGGRIAAVLRTKCVELADKVTVLRQETSSARDDIAGRLKSQLSELLADHVTEERLAQEAAMLAIRADVSEELDRLSVHGEAFRSLLSSEGAAGRRLEFLTQELMREASTLTAKLHTAALKNEGLDLKELVDALREQVLNIA